MSPVGREVNPLGVITHGQRDKPRACQRQWYKPRTCQSMVNTLQVDGLARISGYDKDHICRILIHWTGSPHALFFVFAWDGGRVKTMNGLVDRDRKLPVDNATLISLFTFDIKNDRDLDHAHAVGIVPESGEVLKHYHYMFNRTDTTCLQIKMGMVMYLGGDHHMFNRTDTTCQQVNLGMVTYLGGV